MIKKRENYKILINEPAKTRIAQNLCPSCSLPRDQWKKGRLRYHTCSPPCNNDFWRNYTTIGWSDLRQKALIRDGYRCVKCGSAGNHVMVPRQICAIPRDQITVHNWANAYRWETAQEFKTRILRDYSDRNPQIIEGHGKIKAYINWSGNLIGDHIIPIALGGDEWDIKNVQTLCAKCNAEKTKVDAANIAKQRRKDKLGFGNQTLDQNDKIYINS